MHLYAISDLHLGHEINRNALLALPAYPDDWLIVAGDVGETETHLRWALTLLTDRFAQVIWAPGNHDLWTLPAGMLSGQPLPGDTLRGEAKYRRLVAVCREFGVLTPEDAYAEWPGAGAKVLLAPLFLLYDYSFRPAHLSAEQAVAWAEEAQTICADEHLLHPDPYPSRAAWCMARCDYSEQRLQVAAASGAKLILINHFPLRQEMAVLPRIPRFSIWCGTTRTDDWHRRFPVSTVIHGHLHIRNRQMRDGVRFEEVSLGYPAQWQRQRGIEHYLRRIL
ncbi:MAG: metallophosphoesterase [Caldilineaceae bacterium]|nr:metallophosphoesterase [Caldilineaceae bacterium]MBP8109701.1 metallophosphoesterase [Caldilineaceae bacterium]MBP8124639.1 metallophosphoesterase [Caldilineaceae bacterium]MBP9070716.1 metallophosphoesterase [Caldilineaceae bacterium]